MTSDNLFPSTVDLGDDGSRMKEFSLSPLQEEELRREQHQCQATIDMLPDNVVLEIFDIYREDPRLLIFRDTSSAWRWQGLTRVCRRWRDIVFGSPRRLQLQVICTTKTPTRTMLDIWLPLPIIVFDLSLIRESEEGFENIIAAVECHDRISQIITGRMDGPATERLAAIMQEPFPLLTSFYLGTVDKSAAVLHEAFLGGSAPLLELFALRGISFPTFPKFILSATHIVNLYLFDIPDSGYISPKEMATCLAALPNLEFLALGFRSPVSCPLRVGLPPLTCVVLPALTTLSFKGASEYLEDLLARTHIPLLKWLDLRFFMDLIFDIPRLRMLVVQAEGLTPLSPAWVRFDHRRIVINLGLPRLTLAILCEEQDWQLSSLAHVCNQHLPLSGVEQLSICELNQGESILWKDDMDPSQWLELFHPFVAVRTLYVSTQFVPFVTSALQQLTGERAIEVLPVLKNLFLEGFPSSKSVEEAIKPFVSARQLSNYPIFVNSEPPPLPLPTYSRFPGDG